MWSVTRDQPCPGRPGGAVQATCSGVDQQPFDFTNTFKTFGRAKMSTPTPGQKYAIKPGDTLFSIATAAYGAANASQGVTAIETANPGLNPTDLQAGQEINIPILGGTGRPAPAPAHPTPGQQYAIKSGDTLFSIATAAYGAANATPGVTAIEAANPGLNPTALQAAPCPAHARPAYAIRHRRHPLQHRHDRLRRSQRQPGVTAIETANPGSTHDLQAGQEINIPVLGGTSRPAAKAGQRAIKFKRYWQL